MWHYACVAALSCQKDKAGNMSRSEGLSGSLGKPTFDNDNFVVILPAANLGKLCCRANSTGWSLALAQYTTHSLARKQVLLLHGSPGV